MTSKAPQIAELVNLATTRLRGGAPVSPQEGEGLVEAFADLAGERTAATLRADPDTGAALSDLARELREALLAKTPSDMAGHINAMISRYGAQPYLVDDVGQPFHLHFHGSGRSGVEALGGEYAAALAVIVDGYGGDRFGECQAHRCEAVYIDLTRNRSRRYCSAACTARAKTAAYRDRKK